jgi:hypothetical protein
MRMISPNDAVRQAEELMLDGRKAESKTDWMLVMNCLAVNLHKEIAESACLLMARIYPTGLSDDEVVEIVQYQLEKK